MIIILHNCSFCVIIIHHIRLFLHDYNLALFHCWEQGQPGKQRRMYLSYGIDRSIRVDGAERVRADMVFLWRAQGVQEGSSSHHSYYRTNGMAITIPLTSNLRRLSFEYSFLSEPDQNNRLSVPSVAMVFHLVSLDDGRFIHRIGCVRAARMKTIQELLRQLLRIEENSERRV